MAGTCAREQRWSLGMVAWLALLCAPPAHAAGEVPDFARLVRQHGSAVVNISALKRGRVEAMSRVLDDGDDSDGVSLGSGLITSSDGYVLTCAHVVENTQEITVRLIDRREFSARLVGLDSRTDVALLKIDASGLPTATIGNPATVQVGDWVLAIGSPFGFSHSATSGIVSAKGRSLPFENYIPFIQTDVAINPGNSGGPLFNLRGEAIGMNSQIYSRHGGFMGVSFAIPIDLAMQVVDQLKREGRYRRGWLGVSPQEVTRALARAYGLDPPRGALIADILHDGPADRSELQPGDIVLDYDGRALEHAMQLPLLVSQTRPQTRVRLRVLRRGSAARDVYVTVGELRTEASESPAASTKERPTIQVGELSEQKRRQDNVAHGAVIEALDATARHAGLRVGDVVIEIDGRRVTGAAELNRLLAETGGKVAVLRVRRGPQALYVAIEPGS